MRQALELLPLRAERPPQPATQVGAAQGAWPIAPAAAPTTVTESAVVRGHLQV